MHILCFEAYMYNVLYSKMHGSECSFNGVILQRSSHAYGEEAEAYSRQGTIERWKRCNQVSSFDKGKGSLAGVLIVFCWNGWHTSSFPTWARDHRMAQAQMLMLLIIVMSHTFTLSQLMQYSLDHRRGTCKLGHGEVLFFSWRLNPIWPTVQGKCDFLAMEVLSYSVQSGCKYHHLMNPFSGKAQFLRPKISLHGNNRIILPMMEGVLKLTVCPPTFYLTVLSYLHTFIPYQLCMLLFWHHILPVQPTWQVAFHLKQQPCTGGRMCLAFEYTSFPIVFHLRSNLLGFHRPTFVFRTAYFYRIVLYELPNKQLWCIKPVSCIQHSKTSPLPNIYASSIYQKRKCVSERE